MDRRVPDRWWTAVLLPATFALVVSALTLARHAYTGVSVRENRVATVDPGSPGERAGLRTGDLLRPAPGAAVDPLEPNPLQDARPGRPLTLLRERGGHSSPVWIAPAPLSAGERRYKTFLFGVAAVFLLLGGWVWSERRDRLTRVFLLLCVAFSGLLAPQPFLDSPGPRLAYELIYIAAGLFVPVLFMHFFALFPEPRPRPRAVAWVRAGYGLAGVLSAGVLAVALEGRLGSGRWSAALPALGFGELLLFAFGMIGGLALFAASFARTRNPDARRRLRVAFFGTLLGAAPFVAVTAWRNVFPGSPVPGERLAVAFTLLVPASFAWAIAVHRVFDFRVALRAIVVVAIAGLAAALPYLAGEWLRASGAWGGFGEGISGASLAFLALVAALAGPARPWLRTLGARVVPIPGEVSLAAWAPSEEAVRAGDAAALLTEACEQVRHALRLSGCAALRANDGRPALAAQSGARMIPTLGPGFLDAMARHPGAHEVAALDLVHEDRDSLELAGVHWTLPVPGEPAPAVLLLGRRLAGAWLDRRESADLTQLTHHLAVALENADLKREARGRVALAREMEEAHHVQLHRLPRRTPVYPTLDCAAATLSSEPVGGDYYDFIEMAPRDFTLAVGDAAGHGVPAALVLAGVQARFRGEAERARHPGELLESLNRDLVAIEHPERFMGLLCARVDVGSGTLRIANAGLTPPLVRRAGGAFEEVRESGTLLGVAANARYPVSAVELGAGDLAVVYTDGLTEASRGGRLFGVEGIRRVLAAHAHRRAPDVLEELLAAVRIWADEPLDDLTIVVLKQLAPPRGRPRPTRAVLNLEPVPADTVD